MSDLLQSIIKGIEPQQPVIKGGYGTAPSTPAQQTHTSGNWGTASPQQQTSQQAQQPSTSNRTNSATRNTP